jgi:hypothetical protein
MSWRGRFPSVETNPANASGATVSAHRKGRGSCQSPTATFQVTQTSSETDGEKASLKQQELQFGRHTAETSRRAFKETRPLAVGRKALIRQALREATDGCTRFELAELLNLQIQSVCGLIRPLIVAGLLVEDGDTRPTPSGSSAKVVRLSPKLMMGGQSNGK